MESRFFVTDYRKPDGKSAFIVQEIPAWGDYPEEVIVAALVDAVKPLGEAVAVIELFGCRTPEDAYKAASDPKAARRKRSKPLYHNPELFRQYVDEIQRGDLT